jgi:cytoskeleton protein RodZ
VRGVTFFQRIKTPFIDGPADEQARYQPRPRMVGEMLQERREDLGLDLEEIGAMLRIKASYLAALEQGRSHDLPGPTYAIGFIRAYAEFLGLDSEAVLARFKAEAAGVTARPDLALPVPLGERSLPGGALVLVALILALCGYGIWYYLSTEERGRPQRVAAVPAALQPPQPAPTLVPPPPPAAFTADNSAPASTPPAGPSLFGAAASPPRTDTSVAPATPPTVPQPAPPQLASVTAAAPAPAAPANAPSRAAVTPQAASPAPLTTPPPAPVAPLAAPQVAAVSPPAASVAQAPTLAAIAPPASAPAPGAKVTIRALADCWIQVRAPDQSIVFSRVLKSGETYAVPTRAGLSLRTGNAGALEIAVDGKTAPSIGGIGALRRDVALDPAELAAGTAVHG